METYPCPESVNQTNWNTYLEWIESGDWISDGPSLGDYTDWKDSCTDWI